MSTVDRSARYLRLVALIAGIDFTCYEVVRSPDGAIGCLFKSLAHGKPVKDRCL